MARSAMSLTSLATRGSRLSHSLYEAATVLETFSVEVERAAKGVGGFVRALRQIDTCSKHDDFVASNDALSALQEISVQAGHIFYTLEATQRQEISRNTNEQVRVLSLLGKTSLEYLMGHLESLRMTLLVMLQAFRTAGYRRPSKQLNSHDTQAGTDDPAHEILEMENDLIEQQMITMQAFSLYDDLRRETPTSGLSLQPASSNVSYVKSSEKTYEHDASSIEKPAQAITITPASLRPYIAPSLLQFVQVRSHSKRLSAVRHIAPEYTQSLLHQWTLSHDMKEQLRSIADEPVLHADIDLKEKFESGRTIPESQSAVRGRSEPQNVDRILPAPVPRRIPSSPSILFMPSYAAFVENAPSTTQPDLPMRNTADLCLNQPSLISESSAKAAHYFNHSLHATPQTIPPMRAVAAAISKEPENGDDLGIPWRLCLHNSYWHYTDSNLTSTNTHLQPSEAYRDRRGFTEILAAWVCRQAIEEAEYEYLQVQKSELTGLDTRLETAFIVHQPLKFPEVEELVERTIEIVQEKANLPGHHQHHQRRVFQTPSQQKGRLLYASQPSLNRSWSTPVGPNPQPPVAIYADAQSQAAQSNPNHTNMRQRPSSHRSSTHSHTSHRPSYSHQDNFPTPLVSESESDSDTHNERRRIRKEKTPKTKVSNKRAMGTLAKIGGAVALLEGLDNL